MHSSSLTAQLQGSNVAKCHTTSPWRLTTAAPKVRVNKWFLLKTKADPKRRDRYDKFHQKKKAWNPQHRWNPEYIEEPRRYHASENGAAQEKSTPDFQASTPSHRVKCFFFFMSSGWSSQNHTKPAFRWVNKIALIKPVRAGNQNIQKTRHESSIDDAMDPDLSRWSQGPKLRKKCGCTNSKARVSQALVKASARPRARPYPDHRIQTTSQKTFHLACMEQQCCKWL